MTISVPKMQCTRRK